MFTQFTKCEGRPGIGEQTSSCKCYVEQQVLFLEFMPCLPSLQVCWLSLREPLPLSDIREKSVHFEKQCSAPVCLNKILDYYDINYTVYNNLVTKIEIISELLGTIFRIIISF